MGVGSQPPGETIDGADPAPTVEDAATRCTGIVEQRTEGSAGSDIAGGYPNTRSGDAQYGAWLEVVHAGTWTTLHASVVAMPAP